MKINFTWSEMTKGGKILFVSVVILLITIITIMVVYLVQPVFNQVVPSTINDTPSLQLNEQTTVSKTPELIDFTSATKPLVLFPESVSYYDSDRSKWLPGMAGEIYIPNTYVNDRVVQWIDNAYYLDKDITGAEDENGELFIDYRNTANYLDSNNVIYGHNMRSGLKFGTLSRLLKDSHYSEEEDWYIYFNTKSLNNRFKIYSVYTIDLKTFNYIQVGFEGDEFKEFVENTKLYNQVETLAVEFDNVDENSKLLTLSTCVNGGADRLVVHAYLTDSKPI